MQRLDSTLLEKLREAIGSANVLLGQAVSDKYQHDWSSETPQLPLAVLRPAATAEVAEIMRLCSEYGQAVVVQGGLTGLCGGGIAQPGEMAISLEKMQGIEELDQESMTMTVLAGTPLQVIQEAAAAAGFIFPLDLGARGSCNIGGNIATNAGGNQVVRFGMTRNLVLGLEAVLADGTVISALNKMLKNNAGYDLKHLFIGTEGTLGIVTRAVLRLFPQAKSRCTALLALDSFDSVISLLHRLGSEFGGSLSTFEAMWASYYDFIVANVAELSSPFRERYPVYVLTEMEGSDQTRDQETFETTLAAAMEDGLVVAAVIAASEREREDFWHIRDGVGDIGPHLRQAANFDVSLPISAMKDFLLRIDQDFKARFNDCHSMVFGHIGDNNLHIIASTGVRADVKVIYDIVYRAIGSFAGSISAEHGIGIQKMPYLHHSRSEAERALMRKLKQALDPQQILNRNRVMPAGD
ncbi:MAG: FAD-binding oxidoreductase [Pseudomonadales bacterium]|nr:FAD-binding oxidoreductase [Pseudomonadales bacterium]